MIGEALRTLAMRPLLPDPEPILCDSRDLWRDGEMFNDVLRKVGSFASKSSDHPHPPHLLRSIGIHTPPFGIPQTTESPSIFPVKSLENSHESLTFILIVFAACKLKNILKSTAKRINGSFPKWDAERMDGSSLVASHVLNLHCVILTQAVGKEIKTFMTEKFENSEEMARNSEE